MPDTPRRESGPAVRAQARYTRADRVIVENMPDKYRALILIAAWCGLRWGE